MRPRTDPPSSFFVARLLGFALRLGSGYDRAMCGRARLSFEISGIKVRRLAAVFVLLTLAGCAQMAAGQGQVPAPFYPHDNEPDMRSGMGM